MRAPPVNTQFPSSIKHAVDRTARGALDAALTPRRIAEHGRARRYVAARGLLRHRQKGLSRAQAEGITEAPEERTLPSWLPRPTSTTPSKHSTQSLGTAAVTVALIEVLK
jgi:hypothetical protein